MGISEAEVFSMPLGMLNVMALARPLLYADYEKAMDLGCVILVFASVFVGICIISSVRKPWSRLVHQLAEDEKKFLEGSDFSTEHDEVAIRWRSGPGRCDGNRGEGMHRMCKASLHTRHQYTRGHWVAPAHCS